MKHLFIILLATICAVSGYAQTIKSLGYNTTNGQIVAATNVVWTNSFSFSTNTVAAQVRTNAGLGAAWLTNTNAGTFRADIELGLSALTNTNVTNFRTAIGLGATNAVSFSSVSAQQIYDNLGNKVIDLDDFVLSVGTNASLEWATNQVQVNVPILFYGTNSAAATRTNLGLPLPALTNTSNVTTMRALSGSTNTNHPFSGSVSVVGTNNTNVLVFSNGVLQEIQ